MIQKKNQPYREPLSHITQTSPYSIHITSFSENSSNALYLHWHPEAELFYLEAGELDLYIEDKPYHLRSGDGLFIPPKLLHRAVTATSGPVVFRALVFSTELIVLPENSVRFRKYIQPLLHDNIQYALLLSSEVAWQNQILSDLKRLFSCEDSCTELLVEGFLRIIWQSLYHNHFAGLSSQRNCGKMEDLMQNVIWYIQKNYAEEITLETLAREVHLSEGQLCRSFKQLTGSTPFTWLKKYRIMKSCELLLHSDKKVSEIGSLCGFNNISYYNREFLRIMKVTPSGYRKMHTE